MTQNVYIDDVSGHEMRCTLKKDEGLVDFEFFVDGVITILSFGPEEIRVLREELEKIQQHLPPF